MRAPLPRWAVVALVTALVLTLSAASAAAAPAEPEIMATALNNPRQLSLADGGYLLVAEAGSGGPHCGDDGCLGLTGSVAYVDDPATATSQIPPRALRGLPSAASPTGAFAAGTNGVSAHGFRSVHVVTSYLPPEAIPEGLPTDLTGRLLRATTDGALTERTDVADVELNTNPDGTDINPNAYGVVSLPGREYVVDAGANTLMLVREGNVRVLTVFPEHDGVQSVPTAITRGPDGNFYVGELAGEKPGAARVWKVSPQGKLLSWVGGFSSIHGLDIASDGTLYVSELFGGDGGQVVTVAPDGTRSTRPVPFPAGIAIDEAHDKLYVAAWSVSDADGASLPDFTLPPGQIWRMDP